MNRKLFYIQLLALACTTVCGIYFLGCIVHLLFAYNYTHHRFAPGLIKSGDFTITGLLGLGFLCFGVLYRALAGKIQPVSK